MGVCNIINFFRYIIGIFGSLSIIITAYYYFNNYNNFNCGNLKVGIGIGITSIFALVLSALMYCSSCINKVFVPLSSIFVIVTFIYNLNIMQHTTDVCITEYKHQNVWAFYTYLVIALGITSLLSFIFIGAVYKKNKESIIVNSPYNSI